ncbi:Uncharacterized mitochondrial protein AtMg00310 [Linum grandiflorum]
MCAFWWGQVSNRRKIHWLPWHFLYLPLEEGGLGFCNFKLFNQALLANHCWRLLENPNCLLATVLRA